METLHNLLHIILHIDLYLLTFVAIYGFWTYAFLFAVIFCETGFVITPFLPGDSLLFAAGSIAANAQSTLDIRWLFLLLAAASLLGNHVNYLAGRFIGSRLFSTRYTWLFNKNYLNKAHQFYEKHGGKTIILARFIPIIRTFAPFVAGMSEMNARSFSFYNVVSALIWIGSLLSAGYFFGSLPIIKENFSLVIYGIIALSVLPTLLTLIYRKIVSA